MESRITKENITELASGEIFVFGSNLEGRHGAGAALTALKWGAKMHIGYGCRGQTFAIPTKGFKIQTLSIDVISTYTEMFIRYATLKPELTFLVTEIGCGLAGYKPEDIAPLFKDAIDVENIHLPKRFWDILNKM